MCCVALKLLSVVGLCVQSIFYGIHKNKLYKLAVMHHHLLLVCIDVGILNMGVICVKVECDENKEPLRPFVLEVQRIEKIDITAFNAEVKELAHRMRLFFGHFKSELDTADHILVERQPLCGCVAVQELILYRFPRKTILLSPTQMHKLLRIRQLSYEQRKMATVCAARHLLQDHQKALKELESLERKHDVADAVCLLYFYLCSITNPFEKFRYRQTTV